MDYRIMNQIIFKAGKKDYSFKDCLQFIACHKGLEMIYKEIQQSLVCEEYANDEGFECQKDTLHAEMVKFRCHYNLLTAEETEQWLSKRSLTTADLMNYLERQYWYQRFQTTIPQIMYEYSISEKDVISYLWPHLILSGILNEFIRHFSRRVASLLELHSETIPNDIIDQVKAQFVQKIKQKSDSIDQWLQANHMDINALGKIIELEAAYLHYCNGILTHESMVQCMEQQQLLLIKIEASIAQFQQKEIAEEAFLCITEDNEPFASVTQRSSKKVEKSVLMLKYLPDFIQQILISTAEESITKPIYYNKQFVIFNVIRKIMPDINDPEIKMIIQNELLNQQFKPLVNTHIRFTFHS